MAFATIYRMEFLNFEEVKIRVDIISGGVPATTGAVLTGTNVNFSAVGGSYQIVVSPPFSIPSFFYVGMTFTISGSTLNDGTYTCTAATNSFILVAATAEPLVNEIVAGPTVTFTDISTTDPQLITMQGKEADPLVIATINNDQDKFQPIRSKQAVIKIKSDSANGIDISTFSRGPDDNFYVEITMPDLALTIFKGFLILSDNSEPFQPDPQTIVLTATDHYGAIKDLPLVDFHSQNPMGRFRIADILTMALRGTKLILPLYVINNLRIGSGQASYLSAFVASGNVISMPDNFFFYPGQSITISGTSSNNGVFTVATAQQVVITLVGDVTLLTTIEPLTDEASVLATYVDNSSSSDNPTSGHWYDRGYLDAKTFEAEFGECENMYDVICKILGEDCYLCQFQGFHWIRRVDEIDDHNFYFFRFDTSGQADAAGVAPLDQLIGAAETMRFVNADALLNFIRPHGFVKETYPYDLPLEIVCNIDFSRGPLQATIGGGEKHFTLDCWDTLRSNTSSDDPNNFPMYLRRDYINDQEVARYLVIEKNAPLEYNFFRSTPIPVNVRDKFIISATRRTSGAVSGAGSGTFRDGWVQVRLYGDDGTFWTAEGITSINPTARWVACDATFRTNQKTIVTEGQGTDDFTEAQSLYNGDSAEIPVSGYLRILLYACAFDIDTVDTYIDSLGFDYLYYVNGTYQKYSGQSNRVERAATAYFAKRDNTVAISDSPARLLKGAIMFISRYNQLFSGSVDFVTPDQMILPGDLRLFFYDGQVIKIQGSGPVSNDKLTHVIGISFAGGSTTITIYDTFVTETSVAVISEAIFALTRNWYSAAPLDLAINTDPANIHPYGYIQAFSIWNQFRGADDPDGLGLPLNIFTGSVLGLGTDWPDLVHRFFLTDVNPMTNNRYFMLLSMSQDWRSCIWMATLVEVFNTVTGRVYSDPFTFQYIWQ